MSTSRNNIRLKQASYQIRGEVISTLAEAGSVFLWKFINSTFSRQLRPIQAYITFTKHTGLSNVDSHGHALRWNYSRTVTSAIWCEPFPLQPIKNRPII